MAVVRVLRGLLVRSRRGVAVAIFGVRSVAVVAIRSMVMRVGVLEDVLVSFTGRRRQGGLQRRQHHGDEEQSGRGRPDPSPNAFDVRHRSS